MVNKKNRGYALLSISLVIFLIFFSMFYKDVDFLGIPFSALLIILSFILIIVAFLIRSFTSKTNKTLAFLSFIAAISFIYPLYLLIKLLLQEK
ncbi:hypothetical protein EV282_0396 [Fictibacillus sp. BK138]|nr:hypothetical protein EV282_0396 [Fictibacillus sp. BK138]